MNNGDYYTHLKGVEYLFDCIALPKRLMTNSESSNITYIGKARYHENTHDLDLFMSNNVTFVDSVFPHVIYQSEKDYNTDKMWAREVDDFFGYKKYVGSHYEKRFALKKYGRFSEATS